MKLKTKPKQADTADAKADTADAKADTADAKANVANSEGDGGAKSNERKTSDGSLCETQVDDRGEGESEHKGSTYEGEPEDSSPSKLTEMTVEYEPLGVNRRRNRNVSAEILGGFVTNDDEPGTRYAIV